MREYYKQEKLSKKIIFTLSFIATIIYIVYRVFFTVPTDSFIDVFFGIIILSLEILEAFFYGIYYFNILLSVKESPSLPKVNKGDYKDIDIFIATINEDISLLEETITKCKNMKYPDKSKMHIYVCDDGRRQEMKNLCTKLKVNYIDRKDNKDAKAGNYNNALKKTSSPYIAVFDADMQPDEDFLLKTVPYLLVDDNIGFVQSPQSFRNLDIYQLRYKLKDELPHEQEYFFNTIQVAKNQTNSVIYCGTNTVFSRKALVKSGGFATESVTEDLATGLMMESKGYRGLGISEKLAHGLNVNNLDSYLKQKSRWCRGCIQSFKNYKVLKNKGLTLSQKTEYLSTLFYWTFGIRQYFYIIIPMLFPLLGIKLIRSNFLIFIGLFMTQYLLKRLVVDIVENNKTSATWNRIHETILFPSIALDLLREIFNFGSKKFYVSPKHKEKNTFTSKNIYLLVTHTLFFILTFIVLLLALFKTINSNTMMYLITMFWLLSNLVFLGYAIIFDLSLKDIEEDKISNRSEKYSSKLLFKTISNYIKEEKVTRKLTVAFSSILIIITACFIGLGIFNNINKDYNYNFVSKNGWLSVKKNKLVNEHGKEITLRGVSSHHLAWFNYNYTYDNIKTLKDTWGVNIFRVALYTDPDDRGYILNKETKDELIKIVDICIDLDMYVIIDWHILHDNNPETYEKEAIEFFDEMSEKYKDVPNVIYEICNEPNGDEVTWDEVIKPYAERMIKVIRNNSPKSIIIVGTANWSKDTESVILNPIKEENIMYAVHIYLGEDLPTVAKYTILAVNKKLPIIITECAATNGSGDGNLYLFAFRKVISYLERNHISWIAWQFSDKEESSSIIEQKGKRWSEWYYNRVYTKDEMEKMKYNINDYLTTEGNIVKNLIKYYSSKKVSQ